MKAYLGILLSLLSFNVFAQRCSDDTLRTYPLGDISYTQTGFPDPNELPCAQTGVYSEIVIPYKCFKNEVRQLLLSDTTIVVQNLYAVRIESVSNLPSGFCWTTRPANATVSGDDVGILIVKGTTTFTTGVYPLDVKLGICTNINNNFNYTGLTAQTYQKLFGRVVLKVKSNSEECPPVNQ